MLSRRILRAILACAVIGLASPPNVARADFSAAGRSKKKKPRASASPRRPAAARPTQPAAPKKQTSEALIQRYMGIVLNQPGAQFPLQRLSQLYRERDGNVDALVEELAKRAEAGSWNARVALAGVYKQAGQSDLAQATYERAIAEKPDSPVAILALAHLHKDRGKLVEARSRFEQALPLVKVAAEQEQLLRTLLSLTLDIGDFEAAKRTHRELVRRAKGSFFVRAELGRELLTRGKYDLAEQEFQTVVRAAQGDNRALAPAMRDLGKALAKQNKTEDALQTLRSALRIAGQQAGLRREIFDIIVEVHRASDRMPELISLLEQEHVDDFERLRLLGGLYEETGRIADAIKTYRRALQKNARDIDVRLRLVQLLQIQGELDESVKQYEQLVRAAPHNPDFIFQLADSLIQQGERQRALAHLAQLERRSQRDEDALAALVDFYERVGEKDRALAILEHLSRISRGDPRHLVELGARHYERGDAKKAEQVWRRILVVIPNRARAQHALGEVYLEHDMTEKALEALKTATELEPKQVKYRKAYALALERAGASHGRSSRARSYDEALAIWQELLRDAGSDRNLEREARQHVVTLWALGGRVQDRIPPLERRLAFVPPDLDAGRLLAEVYMRVRRYSDAERVLQIVVANEPGDISSYLRLERAQVGQRRLAEAIQTLEALVKLEPKRAREYYQRMAQYAAEQYMDDEAIEYSAKAVELSPDDALGHKKLGEMYRRRQQTDKAISEFWKAISKNDRLFPVYLDLAELLLAQQQEDEADKLLRRVIRSAHDDELVSRAARLSMQVNLGRGTLESLEKELLPVALANPRRPLYRRLLVEIYGAMTLPLVHAASGQNPAARAEAEGALARIGNRAVKPLLDALGDDRESQQRIAIELLSHLRNPSAATALLAYATGTAPSEHRVRAMIAVGMLATDALLPRLVEALTRDGRLEVDDGDPVSVAAVWSIVRIRSKASRVQLRKLLSVESPRVRALCALGLGLGREARDVATLTELAGSLTESQLVRAAAAFSAVQILDGRGSESPPAGLVAALTQLAQLVPPRLRASVLVSLARLRVPEARKLVAQSLVSLDVQSRTAGLGAARVMASGEYRPRADFLGAPTSRIDVERMLAELSPAGYSPDVDAQALVALEQELLEVVRTVDGSDSERVNLVAESLLARGGEPALSPLTDQLEAASTDAKRRAVAVADRIAGALVPTFVALARHPSARQRTVAIRFLGTRPEPEAVAELSSALSDPEPQVRRAALAGVARLAPSEALEPVARVLADHGHADWATRARAATTLGAIAAAGPAGSAARTEALSQLARAAANDEYSLVREKCLEAMWAADRDAARPVLEAAARRDPEPRLRETAQRLLSGEKE